MHYLHINNWKCKLLVFSDKNLKIRFFYFKFLIAIRAGSARCLFAGKPLPGLRVRLIKLVLARLMRA